MAAALVLLVGVLWFGDGDRPSSPPVSANDAPMQADSNASEPAGDELALVPDAATGDEPAGTPASVTGENESAPTPENVVSVENVTKPEADKSELQASTFPPMETKAPEKPSEKTDKPAKSPKVTSTPVKPDSLSDGYFVDLGVFDDTDHAGRLLDNASALGLPAHIQSRVVVGPFRSKREARAARDRLRSVAEGTVLPPQKTATAGERPKAKPRSRQRAK
ncbi:MAG: SPOR domain-containing protein [Azoarcus sp.]|nr:SPOR domain-containing protein [Azoarcus sp.]